MKLINKKDNQTKFVAEIDESLANAIRRYLNRVPTLAIEEVEISKNDSALYDETVAHRIGLIPLKMDKLTKDSVKMKLSVKKEGFVYSSELTGGAEVVYGNIPITSLKKGQEIEIVATTKIGKGEEHAKFSPGLMFYRNIFDVKVEKDCPQEVVEVCPQNILKSKEGKVIAEETQKCDICEACTELCDKKGKKDSIKITPTKELLITLEAFGQLSADDMIKGSVKELKKDLADVSKKIGK